MPTWIVAQHLTNDVIRVCFVKMSVSLCIILLHFMFDENSVRNLCLPGQLRPHTDGSFVFSRWRQCDPHLLHASLGSPESISQTASWSMQPFLHSSRNRLHLVPLEIAPSCEGSGPPSNMWFSVPTRVHTPNSISISLAIFAGLMIVTDQ